MNVETSREGASFEVVSPWADIDPVALRGITPRPGDLAGKKIGLFSNGKRAAALTLSAFEARLKESVPTVETSWYTSTKVNTPEMLTEGKARFEKWVKGVDAVVLSVAD
jgi:hypothetical protein